MLEKKWKLYTLIIGIIGTIMMLISGVMLVASRDSHYMAIGFVVLIMLIGFCLLIVGIYIDCKFCQTLGSGICFMMIGCLMTLDGSKIGQYVSVVGVAVVSATFAAAKQLMKQ